MKAILLLAAIFLVVGLGACATRPPLATVPSVDLRRYAGTWHEIARYPNWFQRKCTGPATAEYTPLPDGRIQVVNRCRRADGSMDSVTGTATVVPGSNKTKLKVGFGGPFRGDYWIIGLDQKNYSWALVGHPSRKFLWILARDPNLPDRTYNEIVALAVSKGYDASRIQRTDHP
ncbi:MAG: lipocalin family protein [Terrimicrobiaceae bacterium]|nr:lipocalin family protein [Terrimicrobiaceae bacterium]